MFTSSPSNYISLIYLSALSQDLRVGQEIVAINYRAKEPMLEDCLG